MNEKQLYAQIRAEKIAQRQKDERYVRDAATRVQGAISVLRKQRVDAGTDTDRWRLGHATERFLWAVVSDLNTLVPYLDYSDDEDDYYLQEDIQRDVAELYRALKRLGQHRKMENTSGRTPEEIAAFEAKVAKFDIGGESG